MLKFSKDAFEFNIDFTSLQDQITVEQSYKGA